MPLSLRGLRPVPAARGLAPIGSKSIRGIVCIFHIARHRLLTPLTGQSYERNNMINPTARSGPWENFEYCYNFGPKAFISAFPPPTLARKCEFYHENRVYR